MGCAAGEFTSVGISGIKQKEVQSTHLKIPFSESLGWNTACWIAAIYSYWRTHFCAWAYMRSLCCCYCFTWRFSVGISWFRFVLALQHDMLVCFFILTVLCRFFSFCVSSAKWDSGNGLHVEALTYLGENFHFIKNDSFQNHGLVDVLEDENRDKTVWKMSPFWYWLVGVFRGF